MCSSDFYSTKKTKECTDLNWCLVFALFFLAFLFLFLFSLFEARLALVAIGAGWDAVLDGADITFNWKKKMENQEIPLED